MGWHHKVTPRQSGSEWSCLRNVSVLYFLSPAAPELLDPPKSLSHGKQTVTISTRRGRKEAGRVSIVTSPSPESVVEVKSIPEFPPLWISCGYSCSGLSSAG